MAIEKESKTKTSPKNKKTNEKSSVASKTGKLNHLFSPLRSKLKYLILFLVLVILFGVGYYYKGAFIVASINGTPVTRVQLWNKLEEEYGDQALNTIVSEQLILQDARKNNITVSSAEVDNQIKTIEDNVKAQGMTMEDALNYWGLSQDSLRRQIMLQLILEKTVKDQVNVSDDEVTQYIKDNLGEDQEMTQDVKDQARNSLEQSKTSDAIQKYLDDLRAKSNVEVYNSKFKITPAQPTQQ